MNLNLFHTVLNIKNQSSFMEQISNNVESGARCKRVFAMNTCPARVLMRRNGVTFTLDLNKELKKR